MDKIEKWISQNKIEAYNKLKKIIEWPNFYQYNTISSIEDTYLSSALSEIENIVYHEKCETKKMKDKYRNQNKKPE